MSVSIAPCLTERGHVRPLAVLTLHMVSWGGSWLVINLTWSASDHWHPCGNKVHIKYGNQCISYTNVSLGRVAFVNLRWLYAFPRLTFFVWVQANLKWESWQLFASGKGFVNSLNNLYALLSSICQLPIVTYHTPTYKTTSPLANVSKAEWMNIVVLKREVFTFHLSQLKSSQKVTHLN